MSDEIKNSCGGSGCNTPEHEKRLGTDLGVKSKILIQVEERKVQCLTPITVGALVEFVEQVYGTDWPEIELTNVHPFLNYTYSVAN